MAIDLVGLLITVVIWGLIFWVLWWGLQRIGLPEPFNKIAVVILVLLVVIVLLNLLGAVGSPMIVWHGARR